MDFFNNNNNQGVRTSKKKSKQSVKSVNSTKGRVAEVWSEVKVDEPRIRSVLDSTLYVCEVKASIQSHSLTLSRLANPPHVQKSSYELVLTNHSTLKDLFQYGFPHFQDWKARSEFGGLYVNGRVYPLTLPLSKLPLPCRIEYYQPKGRWEDRHACYPNFNPNWICHHHDGLLVVFKPFHLPTKPPKCQHRHSLYTYLHSHFNKNNTKPSSSSSSLSGADKTSKPAKTLLHFPSRLDCATGGIVAISSSKAMSKQLQYLFAGGKHGQGAHITKLSQKVSKVYLLAVTGEWNFPTPTIEVDRPIGPHPEHRIIQICPNPKLAGNEDEKRLKLKAAVTVLTLIGRQVRRDPSDSKKSKVVLYVLAQPKTGRTHQIRIHCASLGLPIVGDNFYNGLASSQLHLMAYQLTFPPKTTQSDPVVVSVPPRLLPEWLKGNVAVAGSEKPIMILVRRFLDQSFPKWRQEVFSELAQDEKEKVEQEQQQQDNIVQQRKQGVSKARERKARRGSEKREKPPPLKKPRMS